MKMKKITASYFKKHCDTILNKVQVTRETFVITKRGKEIARLVPLKAESDDFYDLFASKVTIVGDIVSPALSLEEWGNLG
jgi:prevent-host-death family protein